MSIPVPEGKFNKKDYMSVFDRIAGRETGKRERQQALDAVSDYLQQRYTAGIEDAIASYNAGLEGKAFDLSVPDPRVYPYVDAIIGLGLEEHVQIPLMNAAQAALEKAFSDGQGYGGRYANSYLLGRN